MIKALALMRLQNLGQESYMRVYALMDGRVRGAIDAECVIILISARGA